MSAIQLEECEIIELESFNHGQREFGSLQLSALENLTHATPITEIAFPHINFRDFVRVASHEKYSQFVKIKESGTDIILPPKLASCREFVEKVAEYHYGKKGYRTNDSAYIHVLQGLINRNEELNGKLGLHADISLVSGKDADFADEDIYCVSSCLDTTFFNFPERRLSSDEIQKFKETISKELSNLPEHQDYPFQRTLSAYFQELARDNASSKVNFGSNVIANMSSITPHRAQLAKEDETFRTFLSVHFQSRFKEEFVSNPYLEAVAEERRQRLLHQHSM